MDLLKIRFITSENILNKVTMVPLAYNIIIIEYVTLAFLLSYDSF